MNILSIGFLIIIMLFTACTPNSKVLLYVGTYSDGESKGIYSYQFDQNTGELDSAFVTSNNENPSFLAFSPNQKYLYAVAEVKESQDIDSGSVTAYRVADGGKLKKINKQATKGYHPCHVAVSPDGQKVVASNYSSGSLSFFNVNDDGGLSESFQQVQHDGEGPNEARQKEPHAHSALFSKDGKLLISADLGNDKLEFYQSDSQTGRFAQTSQAFVRMEPGAGPRHFDFSPDGEFIYVMNELNSTVSVLQKNEDKFNVLETVSSLSEGLDGSNSGADIHVRQDGRFVYSSNRGHNSIAVFKRDQSNGKIELLETESVQGDWPRNFSLSPNGKFLLVANKKSNNITVFNIDRETGLLDFTGTSIEVPSPVCLKFLVLAD